jgi:hypothetical protein
MTFDLYIEAVINKLNKYLVNVPLDLVICVHSGELLNNFDIYKNKMIFCITSIDRVQMNSSKQYIKQGDRYIAKQPPEFFNVQVLFLSTYINDKYLYGLNMLSYITSYFNCNTKFSINDNDQSCYDFFVRSKVTVGDEKNNIWVNLKIPYGPSLMYDIGLLAIDIPSASYEKTVSVIGEI